jgi:pyruvate formate lyase activating enzyme
LVASSALKSPSLVLTSVSSPEQDHPTASIPLLPAAFVVSIAAMVLDETEAGLYAATFARGYQLACVALLIVTTLAAFEPTWLAAGLGRAARRLSAWRARLGERPWRLVSFALLVPLAASPLGRCYFRVPFLLCHVCPRQCAFGVMRPYLVPAALIANLRGRRFCEAVCPLGMVGRSLERTRARRAARVAKLWIPRALVLVLTAVAYLWAWSDRGEGVRGGPFYQALYRNVYAPSLGVLLVAALVLLLSIFVRRPFCDGLCPIGASSDLLDALARRQTVAGDAAPVSLVRRRKFLEQSAAGAGAVLVGGEALSELAFGGSEPTLAVGFRNDAPGPLDDVARPAAFASRQGGLVRCTLCPHECILGENDRGFCRTRVVKGGRLYTLAYGNLCSRHLDPMEKKPLYHFLPATPIVSVAMGGCNLRCLNCQNWEISQSRPHEVASMTLLPAELARTTRERGARAVAYTYSEPLVAYEYVRDSAALAREQGLANVLVTAGYVSERPLRELCRVIDAVTLDVKAFREEFYREVSGARLSPVLRTLEVLREERVWTEVSFLMVPTLSDDTREIGAFAGWVAKHLGRGTPLHILRFHPAHRLKHLPPTPVAAMEEARLRARDAGLDFVYLGNVPGHDANHTRCPKDGRVLIERNGFQVRENHLIAGRCPCGEVIPGVFA